jgi:hypothetical protein
MCEKELKMQALFIPLGIAALVSSLVLFRYVANLARHLPTSNEDLVLEMRHEQPRLAAAPGRRSPPRSRLVHRRTRMSRSPVQTVAGEIT